MKIKRKKMKKKLGLLFIQKGKFLTSEEYTALAKEQPVLGSSVKRIFGSYARMLSYLKQDEALTALVAQSASIQEAKRAPEPIAKPVPKPVPKATFKDAFKPAPKVASKVEK
jgi:hypothetical protein